MMIDTHAHLFLCQRPLSSLLSEAQQAGISHIINVGISMASSHEALSLSLKHPQIVPTLGLHPSFCHEASYLADFENLLSRYPFKAIGEIGLDYFKDYAPHDLQKDLFIRQMDIAQAHGLPVIIHNRHADEDMMDITGQFPDVLKVFHCFSSSPDFATAVMGPTTRFSFTGMITYAKRGKVIQALREIPLDYLMLETDSPYLTPLSFKGEENQPAYLEAIAEKIAEVKGVSSETVKRTTTQVAKAFFKLT